MRTMLSRKADQDMLGEDVGCSAGGLASLSNVCGYFRRETREALAGLKGSRVNAVAPTGERQPQRVHVDE